MALWHEDFHFFSTMFSEHIVQQPTVCIEPAKATKAHLRPRGVLYKRGVEEGKSRPRVLGWPCKCRYSDKRGTLSKGLASIRSELRDKQILSTLMFHLPTSHHFETFTQGGKWKLLWVWICLSAHKWANYRCEKNISKVDQSEERNTSPSNLLVKPQSMNIPMSM